MTKKQLKKIAKRYGANVKGLKHYLSYENGKLKDIGEFTVIEILYENASDLLYCRNRSLEEVEYIDKDKAEALAKDYTFVQDIKRLYEDMKDDPLTRKEFGNKIVERMFRELDWGIDLLKELKTNHQVRELLNQYAQDTFNDEKEDTCTETKER